MHREERDAFGSILEMTEMPITLACLGQTQECCPLYGATGLPRDARGSRLEDAPAQATFRMLAT